MNRPLKWLTSTTLIAALSLSLLTGCGQKTTSDTTASTPSNVQTSNTSTTAATSSSAASQASHTEPWVFTDSVGRSVTVPAKIEKIAPSGPLAQLVLYTAYPEKLAGIAKSFSKKQLNYFPEQYAKLPEFGQMYGGKANLNKETLLDAAPDVIIDIGEPKKTIKEDMDQLQSQLNIPTIFIEAKLPNLEATYQKLAELIGDRPEINEMANYAHTVIEHANTVRDALKDDQKVSVYWAMGDEGLNTNAEDSFQSEVLQIVGADNVAKLDPVSKGGGTEVSFEQLLQWKPTYVLVDNPKLLKTLKENENWQAFFKETGAKPVLVPSEPYGVLASPPSVNRLLGINWLGHLLYPDQYTMDIKEETKKFCHLFYHFDPTDEQLNDILGTKD